MRTRFHNVCWGEGIALPVKPAAVEQKRSDAPKRG
jgi:hypothetical protein